MPIFEYECPNANIDSSNPRCLKREEVFMSPQDEKDFQLVCECGKNLIKIVSASSFQLKGTGWYRPSAVQDKD